MKNPKILIVEDNAEVRQRLQAGISQALPNAIIELADSPKAVTTHINPRPVASWDVILLDYFFIGADGDNFGVFDIEKFGRSKVIGISSSQGGNAALMARGVTHIVPKDYAHWHQFTAELLAAITQLIK